MTIISLLQPGVATKTMSSVKTLPITAHNIADSAATPHLGNVNELNPKKDKDAISYLSAGRRRDTETLSHYSRKSRRGSDHHRTVPPSEWYKSRFKPCGLNPMDVASDKITLRYDQPAFIPFQTTHYNSGSKARYLIQGLNRPIRLFDHGETNVRRKVPRLGWYVPPLHLPPVVIFGSPKEVLCNSLHLQMYGDKPIIRCYVPENETKLMSPLKPIPLERLPTVSEWKNLHKLRDGKIHPKLIGSADFPVYFGYRASQPGKSSGLDLIRTLGSQEKQEILDRFRVQNQREVEQEAEHGSEKQIDTEQPLSGEMRLATEQELIQDETSSPLFVDLPDYGRVFGDNSGPLEEEVAHAENVEESNVE